MTIPSKMNAQDQKDYDELVEVFVEALQKDELTVEEILREAQTDMVGSDYRIAASIIQMAANYAIEFCKAYPIEAEEPTES